MTVSTRSMASRPPHGMQCCDQTTRLWAGSGKRRRRSQQGAGRRTRWRVHILRRSKASYRASGASFSDSRARLNSGPAPEQPLSLAHTTSNNQTPEPTTTANARFVEIFDAVSGTEVRIKRWPTVEHRLSALCTALQARLLRTTHQMLKDSVHGPVVHEGVRSAPGLVAVTAEMITGADELVSAIF